MRPLLTLLLTSATLLAGSAPPPGDTATRKNELTGTWALRYVEWKGERTDQEVVYGGSGVAEAREIDPVRRFRPTITFGKDQAGKDRLLRRGSFRWANEDEAIGFRVDWGRFPTEIRTADGCALIVEVDGDVMRWCCRGQGDGMLPDRFASSVQEEELYLLVFHRVK